MNKENFAKITGLLFLSMVVLALPSVALRSMFVTYPTGFSGEDLDSTLFKTALFTLCSATGILVSLKKPPKFAYWLLLAPIAVTGSYAEGFLWTTWTDRLERGYGALYILSWISVVSVWVFERREIRQMEDSPIKEAAKFIHASCLPLATISVIAILTYILSYSASLLMFFLVFGMGIIAGIRGLRRSLTARYAMGAALAVIGILFNLLVIYGGLVLLPYAVDLQEYQTLVWDLLPEPSANMARANLSREMNPNIADGDIRMLVDSNNAFAFDTYRALSTQEGNVVFSPYSLSRAFALTYLGARGGTETQIAQVLRFDLPQDRMHPTFNALDLALTPNLSDSFKSLKPMRLHVADAIWVDQKLSFSQDFLDQLAQNYGAGVRLANFSQPVSVAQEMKDWVNYHTAGNLSFEPTPSGPMVLADAVYFNADWLQQFEEISTGPAPFYLLDGSEVQVDMMSADGIDVRYTCVGDNYCVVELPYAENTAAMDIILPGFNICESSFFFSPQECPKTSLYAKLFHEVESELTSAGFNEVLQKMEKTPANFSLPKFEFKTSLKMEDTLARMGMPNAFDKNTADFSGIAQEGLYIERMDHNAFISVDEEGTTAAAVTVGVFYTISGSLAPEIIIDRPFIFAIRDLKNGQILFMGRVLNPLE